MNPDTEALAPPGSDAFNPRTVQAPRPKLRSNAMIMDRLEELRLRLAASVDAEGKAKPGYGLRVETLKVEIAKLETARGGATKNPGESSSGT